MKYQTLTILLTQDTHIPAKYVADLVIFDLLLLSQEPFVPSDN